MGRMNAAEEREVIAEALYDEHRVTVYRRAYLEMWHLLGAVEQEDWRRKAGRIQQRLADARKSRRRKVA